MTSRRSWLACCTAERAYVRAAVGCSALICMSARIISNLTASACNQPNALLTCDCKQITACKSFHAMCRSSVDHGLQRLA